MKTMSRLMLAAMLLGGAVPAFAEGVAPAVSQEETKAAAPVTAAEGKATTANAHLGAAAHSKVGGHVKAHAVTPKAE